MNIPTTSNTGKLPLSTFEVKKFFTEILTNILILVTFLIPVSAIILSALFLTKHLHATHYPGNSAISVGRAAIEDHLVNQLRKKGMKS